MIEIGPKVMDPQDAAATHRARLEIGFQSRDIWIGAFVAPSAVYICPLPMVLFRVARGRKYVEAPYFDPWAER